ncbi:MAG: TM2 domain-containing protein [Clostridia bacterium]|nr:TM2 domain-containing protein [Clostridia bacterium]
MKKSRYTALILCWFLGFFGIHRLYVGKLGSGFLMLYGTVVAACILYLNLILGLVAFTVMGSFVVNDFLRIATKTFKDCYGKYVEDDKV